jgi:hypothetical protein
MKGLSNHQRMVMKKVGRAGQETKSRARRNRQSKLMEGKNNNE